MQVASSQLVHNTLCSMCRCATKEGRYFEGFLVPFKTKTVLTTGSEGLVAIVTFRKTLPGILLNLASEASVTQYCLS